MGKGNKKDQVFLHHKLVQNGKEQTHMHDGLEESSSMYARKQKVTTKYN